MKLDYARISPPQISKLISVFFYGTDDSYLNFCVDAIIDLHATNNANSKVERYTQESFLSQHEILLSQMDLFSPKGAVKLLIITDATDKMAAVAKKFLADPSQDTVLLFPCLTSSTTKKLKTLHESSPQAGMISCYLNSSADKKQYLQSLITKNNLNINEEAFRFLAFRLEEAPENLNDDLTFSLWI